MEVDWDASDSKAPFSITQLTPIQLASFNLEGYHSLRTQFSTGELIGTAWMGAYSFAQLPNLVHGATLRQAIADRRIERQVHANG